MPEKKCGTVTEIDGVNHKCVRPAHDDAAHVDEHDAVWSDSSLTIDRPA